MRISDWSSDVCSSDLLRRRGGYDRRLVRLDLHADRCVLACHSGTRVAARWPVRTRVGEKSMSARPLMAAAAIILALVASTFFANGYQLFVLSQIGRASCRERGCQNV